MNDHLSAFANADSQLQTRLWNSSIVSDIASLTRHFAMRHRNFSSAAIGRAPHFFLDEIGSEAQQSALEIKPGKSPCYQVLQTLLLLSEQTQTDQVQCSLLRAEDDLQTSYMDRLQCACWKSSVVLKLHFHWIGKHRMQCRQVCWSRVAVFSGVTFPVLWIRR